MPHHCHWEQTKIQKRQQLKPGKHYTEYFYRFCSATSNSGKLQTTYHIGLGDISIYRNIFNRNYRIEGTVES
jgi:hypothetical protein